MTYLMIENMVCLLQHLSVQACFDGVRFADEVLGHDVPVIPGELAVELGQLVRGQL